MEQVPFVKVGEFAKVPSKKRNDDAGYDLFSAYSYNIPPRGREAVDTGIALTAPKGTYGRIAPTSNLSYHSCLDVGGGVVDRGFKGTLKVILFNHNDKAKLIHRGDKIAQIIFQPIQPVELIEVSCLEASERGYEGLKLHP